MSREAVVASLTEAASRRLRGVLREERASLNRMVDEHADTDLLRAVVANHAERFGDVLNSHVQQVAYRAWAATATDGPLPVYVIQRLEQDARPVAAMFAGRRWGTVDRLQAVLLAHRTRETQLRMAFEVLRVDYGRHDMLCRAIADTEVGAGYTAGAVAGWFSEGVEALDWRQGKACAEGVCDDFAHGGPYRMQPSPMGLALAAPLPPIHPSCSCYLTPVLEASPTAGR